METIYIKGINNVVMRGDYQQIYGISYISTAVLMPGIVYADNILITNRGEIVVSSAVMCPSVLKSSSKIIKNYV